MNSVKKNSSVNNKSLVFKYIANIDTIKRKRRNILATEKRNLQGTIKLELFEENKELQAQSKTEVSSKKRVNKKKMNQATKTFRLYLQEQSPGGVL